MTDQRNDPAPVLLAFDVNNGQVRVWCAWCQAWHYHYGEGLRVAKCDKRTPYTKTGYVLKLAGKGGAAR